MLKDRTQQSIEAEIGNHLVYEIDGSLIGCIHLRSYGDGSVVEIGSVYVQTFYQNRGVGSQLIQYACDEAKRRGASSVFALTTQAVGFFATVCEFKEADVSQLPLSSAKLNTARIVEIRKSYSRKSSCNESLPQHRRIWCL